MKTKASIENNIIIKGARLNNLKNIDVKIPRNKFTVITGVSGSGKSTLAYDTIFAEGQRRYLEGLSSYAKQFLNKMNKPEVDYIKGISPAISIKQKTNTNNPKSTVGTSSEIYDLIRILFSRFGKFHFPNSKEEIKKYSTKDVIKYISKLKKNQKFLICYPTKNISKAIEIGLKRCIQNDSIKKVDALSHGYSHCDYIITNPPWNRKILHPMIEHFVDQKPTWLLFDADWVHTKQSIPYISILKKIVSIGRVQWIPNSKATGKDNCCWYLFDSSDSQKTQFFGRT
mgnify:CR=1 FL=1